MNEVNAICGDVSESQKGRVYGYVRVSTKEQNLARQIEALTSWGVDVKNIYQDKASGKDFERPEYIKLSKKLKHGDVLVIKSIDRLGRCYDDIIAEWRRISHAKGVAIVVIDMPLLDTRECANMQAGLTGRFISDIVLQLLSYVANIERDNIRQRQAEGIALAKARGVQFGRPAIKRPPIFETIVEAYERGELTRKKAAIELKVSPNTFDKCVKSYLEAGSS